MDNICLCKDTQPFSSAAFTHCSWRFCARTKVEGKYACVHPRPPTVTPWLPWCASTPLTLQIHTRFCSKCETFSEAFPPSACGCDSEVKMRRTAMFGICLVKPVKSVWKGQFWTIKRGTKSVFTVIASTQNLQSKSFFCWIYNWIRKITITNNALH